MAWTAQPDEAAEQALAPLALLEGVWHGDGTGPYGPIEHETQATWRGRWLLLTGTIFEPDTDNVTYVSTQVFGYDADGLVLQYFDTAGAFDFRGETTDEGLTFTWKRGDAKFGADVTDLWKTSEFSPTANGEISFRYRSMEPAAGEDPLTFTGTWKQGVRPPIA
jgi:hypothetical protein